MIGSIIKHIKTADQATKPELHKANALSIGGVYALKQADNAQTPTMVVQLVGCNPVNTKDGGSTAESNDIEITCIADHPRTAFQMASLLRMGFDKNGQISDTGEGVEITDMHFVNWASDVFEATDLFSITLRFEAFSILRQDLTSYLN